MLDYLETGLFHGHPDASPRPRPRRPDDPAPSLRRRRPSAGGLSGGGPSGGGPSGGAGAGLRRLLTDRRVLTVAAVVATALAILAGTSLPLRSTQAGPGRPSMAPSMAPRSPSTSPGTPTRAPSTEPSPDRPPGHSTASPGTATSNGAGSNGPGSNGAGSNGTGSNGAGSNGAGSNGAGPAQATPTVTAGTAAGAGPAASAPATRRAARAAGGPAVVVTFTVTSRGDGLFEGELRIVNDGTRPLASWQVSVALPGDQVVAIANASGSVINGILLLEPAAGATPVPPDGGVLDVFFVAAGPQPVSGACTYNQTPCA